MTPDLVLPTPRLFSRFTREENTGVVDEKEEDDKN
jgi:hypothetical protein